MQHRGRRRIVSHALRNEKLLPTRKTIISLHFEQIFFEQSFAICDENFGCPVFLAEFFATMKSASSWKILMKFIVSFFLFRLNYQM